MLEITLVDDSVPDQDRTFYRVALKGDDLRDFREQGLRRGDLIRVSLRGLTAHIYWDRSKSPAVPVGYIRGEGYEPVVLDFARETGEPDGEARSGGEEGDS